MRPSASRAIPALSMTPIIGVPMPVPVGSRDRTRRGSNCRPASAANGSANDSAAYGASCSAALCETLS